MGRPAGVVESRPSVGEIEPSVSRMDMENCSSHEMKIQEFFRQTGHVYCSWEAKHPRSAHNKNSSRIRGKYESEVRNEKLSWL